MKIFLGSLILGLSLSVNAHQVSSALEFLKEPAYLKTTIKYQNKFQTMRFIKSHEMDLLGVDLENKMIDLYVNDQQFDELSRVGLNPVVVESAVTRAKLDDEYKNPDEIESFLRVMNDRFPEISKLVVVGKTLEDRTIYALKISDNPEQTEIREPVLLFNGMHHAREVMSPEVNLDIIEYLLTRYQTDDRVKNWVDQNEIYVLPMLNLDGNNKVWEGSRMWRKNVRNGYGVDLNRNYPFNWNKCNGSSSWTRSQTYRGPEPASEPETRALMSFVEKVRPVFDISYHSFSELVLYPQGCRGDRTHNRDVVEKVGRELGEKLNYTAGTPWELLYNADGGDIDWMYGVYHVIPYVIELNSRSEGFQPSYSEWRDKTVERNRVGWMHLIDRVQASGVRGRVPEALMKTDSVLKLQKVTRSGNEDYTDNYPLRADGAFHFVLNPGEYSLSLVSENKTILSKRLKIGDKLQWVELGE